MKLAGTLKQVISAVVLMFCLTSASYSRQPAFPTAEGYGKYAVGGRGGSVNEVTTLNPTGAGSLGAAIGASGPRTVVFRVAGTINGNFSIRNDNITIAGQTAPGDGICIKGSLGISANNVIIRYIRVRNTVSGDALGGRYNQNIILDHVSASWSSDEVLSLYHNHYVTIQYCMITEACSSSHRFGGIWGNNYSYKSTAEGCTSGIGHRWCTISSTAVSATFTFTPTFVVPPVCVTLWISGSPLFQVVQLVVKTS